VRYITKTIPPDEISEALEEAFNNELSWNDFGRDYSRARYQLRHYLKQEQSGLCAYSEVSFKDFDFHIEHIKPKGRTSYPELRFTYENLVASSPKHKTDVQGPNDLFGGHQKEENYDENLFISPTTHDCARFFQYSPNGSIGPSILLSDSDKLRANHTIDCLGLESSKLLVNLRRRAYTLMQSQIEWLIDEPVEAIEEFLETYFELDAEGSLKPFQSLVMQIAGK